MAGRLLYHRTGTPPSSALLVHQQMLVMQLCTGLQMERGEVHRHSHLQPVQVLVLVTLLLFHPMEIPHSSEELKHHQMLVMQLCTDLQMERGEVHRHSRLQPIPLLILVEQFLFQAMETLSWSVLLFTRRVQDMQPCLDLQVDLGDRPKLLHRQQVQVPYLEIQCFFRPTEILHL